jgi:hypothetical protein
MALSPDGVSSNNARAPLARSSAMPLCASRLALVRASRLEVLGLLGVLLGGAPSSADVSTDGVWVPLDPPARQGFGLVRDAARNRLVLFGGLRNSEIMFNEVWTFALDGSSPWRVERPLGTPPVGRSGPAAAYDSRRGRMIIFGGFSGPYMNDVWSLDLVDPMTWHAITPLGTPPSGREYASAVYDSVRDRVLLFGGASTSGSPTDLWELSLAGTPTWNQLSPAGTPPPGRAGAVLIVDPVRDRLVLFGGNGPYFGNDPRTWVLNLYGSPSWQDLGATGPAPGGLYGCGGVYDPIGDRLVTSDGPYNGRPYALSLVGAPIWTPLLPQFYSGAQPASRYDGGAVHDPAHRAFVVYGGYMNSSFDDTWSFSLDGYAWTKLAPPGPDLPPRANHTVTLDPATNRVIVFGGQNPFDLNDLWAMHLGPVPIWERLQPTGTPPGQVYGVAAACDTRRHRILYFGGQGTFLGLSNIVSQLDLDGTTAWSTVSTAGDPPTPRQGSTAVYDPVNDRFVIFGGLNFSAGTNVMNEVWSLSLAGTPTWTQLSPGAGPSGRSSATASYDAARHRMLVFGGFNYDFNNFKNDVWALSLDGAPSWTPILPAGTPPAGRYRAIAVVDPLHDRFVVHGGGYADTWALNLTGPPQWNALSPAPPLPEPRGGSAGVFDPVGNRLIEIGGNNGNYRGESWALAWGDVPTPTLLSFADVDVEPGRVTLRWESADAADIIAVVERSSNDGAWTALGTPHLEGTDLLRYEDRDVPPGSYTYRLSYRDNAVQRFTDPVHVDVPAGWSLSMGGFVPNPAFVNPVLQFTLPDALPTRLEILDVRGRVLSARDVGALGAGVHRLPLPEGDRLRPGVYWLRLVRPGSERVVKGVVTG